MNPFPSRGLVAFSGSVFAKNVRTKPFLRSVFNVEFRCFLRLRPSKNNSNGGHLRCLSGSVRAGESRDDAGLDRTLLIVARATSAELESRVYVLGLAQETSEKNTGCAEPERHRSPPFELFFDAQRNHSTRTTKLDDGLCEKYLVADFRNGPFFLHRGVTILSCF